VLKLSEEWKKKSAVVMRMVFVGLCWRKNGYGKNEDGKKKLLLRMKKKKVLFFKDDSFLLLYFCLSV
jgi:hypothetical protein